MVYTFPFLHGQILAAATYEVLKQLKKHNFRSAKKSYFVRIRVIMSSIDLLKKSDFCKFGHIRGFPRTTTILDFVLVTNTN